MNRKPAPLRVVLVLGLTLVACAAGCRQMLIDSQIRGMRTGGGATNTLHDFEQARVVAYAGLGQLEGLYSLSPGNTDAMFLLARSWGGTAYAFMHDDYETALEAGDEIMAEYHARRTRAAFERAVWFASEMLRRRAPGFEQATRNTETLRAWLQSELNDPSDAEDLLWAGYAWIGRVATNSERPDLVAELFVGVGMVEHSVALDEGCDHATGHTILGAYHARSAGAELGEARVHFDRALALNGGKLLATKLNVAMRYHCMRRDKASWERVLREILDAGDPLPEARLANLVAKRRARRYLGNPMWSEECGF